MGSRSSHPFVVAVLNSGNILFFADDSTHGKELWISDGTTIGTNIVKDIKIGNGSGVADNYYPIVANNKLFFVADDGVHGMELWVSDGTDPGTYMIKDINPGINSAIGYAGWKLVGYNNKIFFSADDNISGQELWVTDGTAAGTTMVRDINPGTQGSYLSGLVVAFGKIFFSAQDAQHGRELWSTDGTAQGTAMLYDLAQGADNGVQGSFYLFNGKGYMPAVSDYNNIGYELYTTDGTSITLLKDIVPGIGSSMPSNFLRVGNKLFFRVNNNDLWATDGTAQGTYLVKHIDPGSTFRNSFPKPLGDVGGTLLLNAITTSLGSELWISDGTEAGTKNLFEIFPGSGSYGYINSMVSIDFLWSDIVHNGKVYFFGRNNSGTFMWITDGTPQGSRPVERISDGDMTFYPGKMFITNNKIWLSAAPDLSVGWELYTYNMPTSIEETTKEWPLSTIYPNPSNGTFTVRLHTSNFVNGSLRITDVMGRELYSQSIASNIGDLPVVLRDVPQGLYNVAVIIDNRTSVHSINIE